MRHDSKLPSLVFVMWLVAGGSAFAQGALTNGDVTKMAAAGLSEGLILETIKNASATSFDLSPDSLIALKQAGVGDTVLTAMVSKSAATRPSAASPRSTGTPNTAGGTRRALTGVKTIQVQPTAIANPDKVNEDFAATLVQDALRNALQSSNVEIADDATISAHIVLEEFSSGSTAKRVLVGLGAGRSTVAGRLVLQEAGGRELANVRIRVRGSLAFSSWQGGATQRRQAVASFDQKLLEEIARLK